MNGPISPKGYLYFARQASIQDRTLNVRAPIFSEKEATAIGMRIDTGTFYRVAMYACRGTAENRAR